MNRLTEKDDQGNWALKGINWKQLYIGQIITKEIQEKLYGALHKLLDYEEVGLNPDEVESLKEENKWILTNKKMPKEVGRYRITFKHDAKVYLVGYGSCWNTAQGYPVGLGWYNLQTAIRYPDDSIIAWRPLPDLYKENADE